ncbi:MAG: hypothetical protein AB2803_20650 [Candidatus Thiodiazotropha sp.]
MKLFVSWSGPRSKEMAEFLKDWLGNIFQSLEIFFSGDIQKGRGWHSSIIDELESCDMGIFLLTRKNLQAQWLNYEAGAIAKRFSHSNAFTLLIDDGLDPNSLGPLSHFQATHMNEKDIKKLLYSINDCLGTYALQSDRFNSALDKWMPDFWETWDGIKHISLDLPYIDGRSTEEKIDDILSRVHAENLNYHNLVDQINLFTEFLNEKFSEKLPLIEKKYIKDEREKGIRMSLARITLPDGSQIMDGRLPKGGEFKTWKAFAIATGRNPAELEEFKERHIKKNN